MGLLSHLPATQMETEPPGDHLTDVSSEPLTVFLLDKKKRRLIQNTKSHLALCCCFVTDTVEEPDRPPPPYFVTTTCGEAVFSRSTNETAETQAREVARVPVAKIGFELRTD